MARTKKGASSGSKGRRGGTAKGVTFGNRFNNGLHVGSRDASYRGTLHWDGNDDGKAYLIKPPGGPKTELEFCHPLPVSGEFDIETSGGATVTRDP